MSRLLTTRPKAGKNPALNSPTMWFHSGLRRLPSTGAIFLLRPLCCGKAWKSNIDFSAWMRHQLRKEVKVRTRLFSLISPDGTSMARPWTAAPG